MNNILNKVKSFYADYAQADLRGLAELYDDNVVFIDPVLRVSGLLPLWQYMQHGRQGLLSCRFDFLGSGITQNSALSIEWRMSLRHERLAGGREIQVDGISVLEFSTDGLINVQRDYYDLGALFYENVPLIGRLIRCIKSTIQKRCGV